MSKWIAETNEWCRFIYFSSKIHRNLFYFYYSFIMFYLSRDDDKTHSNFTVFNWTIYSLWCVHICLLFDGTISLDTRPRMTIQEGNNNNNAHYK